MNIFRTNDDPKQCAIDHCDVHLRKMITEHCQIMSTVWRYTSGVMGKVKKYDKKKKEYVIKDTKLIPDFGEIDYSIPSIYLMFNPNHPSCLWVAESTTNYQWLLETTKHMIEEYEYRNGKKHSSSTIIKYLEQIPYGIKNTEPTKFKMAVDKDLIINDDYISIYRKFVNRKYITWLTRTDKKKMNVGWTKRDCPSWVDKNILVKL